MFLKEKKLIKFDLKINVGVFSDLKKRVLSKHLPNKKYHLQFI